MKSLITLTDEQLIASFKEGNAYAMGVLVSRHKVRIYTSIYVLVKEAVVIQMRENSCHGLCELPIICVLIISGK